MNNSELKRIEERLVPSAAPEPPAELLNRIQEEIPRHLQAVPEAPPVLGGHWKLKLLAASVVVVVLSGTVVYQLSRTPDPLEKSVGRDQQVARDQLVVQEQPVPRAGDSQKVARVDEVLSPQVVETPPVAERVNAPEPAPASRAVETPERVEIEAGLAGAARQPQEEVVLRKGDLAVQESEQLSQLSVADEDKRLRARQKQVPLPEPKKDQRLAQGEPLAMMYDAGGESTSAGEGGRRESAAPSTGGTAEPNDAPYGDMFFRAYGTNPFVDTEDDPLSTFGLDVDTGSFTVARSYLDRGHMPPAEAIRVEEFVNYFDYDDPSPRQGEFTLVAEGAPSPFATGPRYQLVRFGIKAREISNAARQPTMLIFVVDVSGSMRRENRLGLVKRSLDLLLGQLDRDDQIGLVVYGSRGEVLLEPTASKEAIGRAIERLVPSGSTNAEEGLDLAYGLARRYYREGAINRIILCSDGVANVGRTGAESILERIRRGADDGIELTTVGFGMGNYNDVLMEQLADQGDGSYAYVDTLDEARRIFVENLTGMLQTVAADAKVQVEFNPAAVSRYRLLGYENRDIADERFRDDTVDAGEIGAGHAVTALYEIKLQEGVGRRARLATIRLRYRSKASDEVVETAVDLRRKHLAERWERGSTALQLSSLAAEFAEILKGSYWAKDGDLEDLSRRLRHVADELTGDQEIQDLLYLVERARRISSDRYPDIDE